MGARLDLDDHEVSVIRGLLRQAILKSHTGLDAGRKKWGANYDDSRQMARLALLEGLYRRLGFDPTTIERGSTP